MPQPRPYSTVVALAALPLVALSLASLRGENLVLFALFATAYAALCLRTYSLTSGILMTAAAPLASTAMLLFTPLELVALVVPGMLVVMYRNRRPWGNTLINITAVGSGLVVGAWLYHAQLELFGLVDAPLVHRVIPYLIALHARDIVNHALVAPVVARQREMSAWQVMHETMLQSGLGHLALNATGLGFAQLISQEGAGLLLYVLLILLGMHAAVSFYVRRWEMERAAEQDGLTRARNRTAFERLSREPGRRGVLVVVDCDGLKQLNDTRGHLAGDEMLKFLAAALIREAGEENVYRYGGDEFVVLLEHPSGISALHGAVEQTESRFGASASLGSCQLPEEAADMAGAFALADKRMYVAKMARRTV
ncbi:MAG: GGDEF domain-containing protein [Bacillota bacterium]